MILALLSSACCVFSEEQAAGERLWSTDQRHYAIVEQSNGQEWSCRITIRASGDRQVSVATAWRRQPDGVGRNAPRECGVRWVGNGRISCQGSINPSTLVLLEFDALTGRELRELFGLEFAWSPDGRLLASRGNVPHFTDWSEKSDSLELDGKPIFPRASDPGRHLFHSELTWAADSRHVAVVDYSVQERAFTLLIAERSGKVTIHRLPWSGAKEVDFPAPRDFTIHWTGRDIVVENDGKSHSVAAP